VRALLIGAVLGLSVTSTGLADEPAKDKEPSKEATPAPTMGGVKDVVKGAVKDAKDAVKEAAAKPAAAIPAAPAAAPAAPADPAAAAAARLVMLRRKTLRDDDFLENEDRNRDPFRSYMRLFIGKEGPRAPKVPAIFDKFALEELTLIGIVSGDAMPRAMFRDPGGLGQTIKRGDYISKAAARVTKILSDRVILELNEVAANGETRALERPILVNPEGAQK
jgi:Tfp pilus assembly protein PilP